MTDTGRDRPAETVVLTTKSDSTIRGVLVARTEDGFVLRAAAVLQTNDRQDRWVPLAGDVVVADRNVDYWQRALPIELLQSFEA